MDNLQYVWYDSVFATIDSQIPLLCKDLGWIETPH